MLWVVGRYRRIAWIVAGVLLALGALVFLLREPEPEPGLGLRVGGKTLPPEELTKLFRENTVRADPVRPRSTPAQPRLDQRQSP